MVRPLFSIENVVCPRFHATRLPLGRRGDEEMDVVGRQHLGMHRDRLGSNFTERRGALSAEEALRTVPRDEEQRTQRLFQLVGRYEQELAENGLSNLQLDIGALPIH